MTQRTGRPPVDGMKIAAALEHVERGMSVTDAARAVGIGKDPVYRAMAAQRAEAARAEPRTPVAASSAPAAIAVPAPPPSAPRPAGGTAADDLAILDAEIDAVRASLAGARAEGKTHGIAALQKNLIDLIRRRRELRPPPPPDPDDEERRWAADAREARMQIEAGVKEVEARIAGST